MLLGFYVYNYKKCYFFTKSKCILLLKNKRPAWCHLLFYFTSNVLNMFRTLIYPSSGACDYSVELPHWSYCSWFDVCWGFGVVGLEWYPCCRLQPATRMMDILMSETCWAHKKWNKIASDIKLVFYSSTIAMMHGPINIRYTAVFGKAYLKCIQYSQSYSYLCFFVEPNHIQ